MRTPCHSHCQDVGLQGPVDPIEIQPEDRSRLEFPSFPSLRLMCLPSKVTTSTMDPEVPYVLLSAAVLPTGPLS